MDLKEDKIEPDIADSELDPTGLLSYCRLSEVQGVQKKFSPPKQNLHTTSAKLVTVNCNEW